MSMLFEPTCTQISYSHSLPWVDIRHWWLSLTAADQGVWFGSIANLLVVAATGITAWIAYRLGSRDATERRALRANTSDIAAGLLFTTIVSLIFACHKLKEEVNNQSPGATELSRRFSVIGDSIRRFLDSIDKKLIADFSMENKEMALALAYALGRIDNLPDLCTLESQRLKDIGSSSATARQHIFNACHEFELIAQPFVEACQHKFRKPLGVSISVTGEPHDQDKQQPESNETNRANS